MLATKPLREVAFHAPATTSKLSPPRAAAWGLAPICGSGKPTRPTPVRFLAAGRRSAPTVVAAARLLLRRTASNKKSRRTHTNKDTHTTHTHTADWITATLDFDAVSLLMSRRVSCWQPHTCTEYGLSLLLLHRPLAPVGGGRGCFFSFKYCTRFHWLNSPFFSNKQRRHARTTHSGRATPSTFPRCIQLLRALNCALQHQTKRIWPPA